MSSPSVGRLYVGLALVQVALTVYWFTQGSSGAVLVGIVGLLGLGGLYLAYRRRRRLTDEYFDGVLADLRQQP